MDRLGVLGQSAPAATTEADVYAVPANAKSAVISTLVVANRSASGATFRLSVSVAGAATANKDYLYYDIAISGNDTFTATLGLTLGSGDVVRCYASTANLSFGAFGAEAG